MDVVDTSNLQRQILHNLDRVGERKVDSAKKTLTAINPDVNVVTYDVRLGADNVEEILSGGWDVIVDGRKPSRPATSSTARPVKLGIPVVHGSIFRFEGMVTVFDPKRGPTYRDMVQAAAARWPRAAPRPACSACSRHHRLHPGHRDDQAAARAGRSPDRSAAGLRLPRAELPGVQGAASTRPTRSPTRTVTGSW